MPQNTAYNVAIDSTVPSYIRSLLIGTSWSASPRTGANVTYAFPTSLYTYRPDYYFDEPNYGFLLTSIQQAAITAGLMKIANVANITFTNKVETPTDQATIRIAGSSQVDYFGAYAWAYYPGNYDEGGDIWFSELWDNSISSAANVAPGTYNFLAVIHEIGHSVGLKHSFSGSPVLPAFQDNWFYTMMAYNAAPGTNLKPTTPMMLDIATLQFLYGENTNAATGDDTYGFNGGLQCIWDARGTDTVSAVGANYNVRIDLHDGTFSSLNGNLAVRDFSIANNAVIENAIGGLKDDQIVGNSANNVLDGSDGNDRLFGGNGNDILIGGKGEDFLFGNNGNDTYIGGEGIDYIGLSDSDGQDTVFFNNIADLGDIITGFCAIDGSRDSLNLDVMFDNMGLAANDRANRIAITQNPSTSEIRLDQDSNGSFETVICTLIGKYNASDLTNCLVVNI